MKSIKGFLIDLDGVLYIENKIIPGAVETLTWLRSNNYPFRFVTNTTMRSRAALADKIRKIGIVVREEEIFSTCVVAASWLKQKNVRKVHLLLPNEPKQDFAEFTIDAVAPDVVIVGDLGRDFNYEVLNKAFRLIKNGARLVALQKNRFWQTLDGLSLDVGAFVAALEYATETEAEIIGKPNRAYFEMALADMKLNAAEVAMVGDDIFTDIAGGHSAGLKTILVKTGKFHYNNLEKADVKPDYFLESIAELPTLISKNLF